MSKGLRLPTLLVVTENPTVRAWAKQYLEEPFFLLYASTQQEAIGAVGAKLDFILVDAAVELFDPLELCKRLRQEAKLTPIFLITGKLKKSFRAQAEQAGVTEFLSDDLDHEELLMRIEEGKKGAQAREKTMDLKVAFQGIPQEMRSLKDKIVLNDQGVKLLKEAKQTNVAISLLLLQIDHFDNWANKEEIALSLGTFVQNLLRAKDVLIPASEGRFLLLLFNTAKDSAQKVADRLKEKISFHPFSALQPLTVSIAVSALDANAQSIQAVVDAASKSLETHKEKS